MHRQIIVLSAALTMFTPPATIITAGKLLSGQQFSKEQSTSQQTAIESATTDNSSTPEDTPKTPPAATPPTTNPNPTTPPAKNVPSNTDAPSQQSANKSILNLTNWKLALPVNTNHAGNPDEITQPELASYIQAPYFQPNSQKNGMIFQAHAGGATTKNSNYPRSELREMTDNGKKSASWSSSSGTHTMTIRQAITHLPVVKPELVAGQIHDDSDDVIMIKLSGPRLFVEGKSKDLGTLDESYSLGKTFTVRIETTPGHIKVFYNDNLKVDYAKSGSGYYFKAGCYTQSNTSKGDAANAYGEVVIYGLSVSHN